MSVARAAAGGGDWLDRSLGYLCAAPLALIAGLTFCDVVARYVFARPITGAAEIIEFAMALAIFGALPLVTRHRSHISVGLLDTLSGAPARAKDMLVDAASLAAVGLITWRLWVQAGDFAEVGTATIVIELPKAYLAYAMCALAGVTFLVIAAQLCRRVARRERSP